MEFIFPVSPSGGKQSFSPGSLSLTKAINARPNQLAAHCTYLEPLESFTHYSAPMFIGVWENESNTPFDNTVLDPFRFLINYSQLLWGSEKESEERAWETNDADTRSEFQDPLVEPDYWF